MTLSNRARELRGALLAAPSVDWSVPADLSRISQGRALDPKRESGRVLLSAGSFRMQPADHSNAVPLAEVSGALSGFQQLVTAMGAAHQGSKHLVGKLSSQILRSMELNMLRRTVAGSVVVEFAPAADAQREELPGDTLFDADSHDVHTSIDRAVNHSLDLIGQASSLGPDQDSSELVHSLRELGPRVSSACRALMTSLGKSEFDVEVTWIEPGQPPRRSRVTRSQAYYATKVFETRELDTESIMINGTLINGGVDAPLDIDGDDGVRYKVSTKNVAREELEGLVIWSPISVRARAVNRVGIGGEIEPKLYAEAVRRDPEGGVES